MMLRALVILTVVLELSACRSRAGYIRGPDGDEWLAIRCSRRKHVNCLKRAGKLCPDGYTVGDAGQSSGTMLIKCGAPQAYQPQPVQPQPLPPPPPLPAPEPAGAVAE